MIVNIKGGLRLPRIFEKVSAFKVSADAHLDGCIDFVKDTVIREIASGTKSFNVQSLFGGKNYDWCSLGFPIGDIWVACREKYANEGYPNPEAQAELQAGIYVGMILKYVCHSLKTNFKMKTEFNHITYTVV